MDKSSVFKTMTCFRLLWAEQHHPVWEDLLSSHQRSASGSVISQGQDSLLYPEQLCLLFTLRSVTAMRVEWATVVRVNHRVDAQPWLAKWTALSFFAAVYSPLLIPKSASLVRRYSPMPYHFYHCQILFCLEQPRNPRPKPTPNHGF